MKSNSNEVVRREDCPDNKAGMWKAYCKDGSTLVIADVRTVCREKEYSIHRVMTLMR
jgi:hypothetical protein